MKMKKLASLSLALVMCVALAVPAFGSEPVSNTSNETVQVVNRSRKISDRSVQAIVNGVRVAMAYDDGTAVPLDSVITIEDVATPSGRAADSDAATSYQVRAVTHVISDSDHKNAEDVSATISLSMRWIDGERLDNSVESLQGSLQIAKGTLESSELVYGDAMSAGWEGSLNLGTQTSFNQYIGKTYAKPNALYTARFVGAFWELNVGLTATVADN